MAIHDGVKAYPVAKGTSPFIDVCTVQVRFLPGCSRGSPTPKQKNTRARGGMRRYEPPR